MNFTLLKRYETCEIVTRAMQPAAHCLFRTRHKPRKETLSVNTFKAMTLKFEETGRLTIRTDIGRKPFKKKKNDTGCCNCDQR